MGEGAGRRRGIMIFFGEGAGMAVLFVGFVLFPFSWFGECSLMVEAMEKGRQKP